MTMNMYTYMYYKQRDVNKMLSRGINVKCEVKRVYKIFEI